MRLAFLYFEIKVMNINLHFIIITKVKYNHGHESLNIQHLN